MCYIAKLLIHKIFLDTKIYVRVRIIFTVKMSPWCMSQDVDIKKSNPGNVVSAFFPPLYFTPLQSSSPPLLFSPSPSPHTSRSPLPFLVLSLHTPPHPTALQFLPLHLSLSLQENTEEKEAHNLMLHFSLSWSNGPPHHRLITELDTALNLKKLREGVCTGSSY